LLASSQEFQVPDPTDEQPSIQARGGRARAESLSSQQRKEIARKGAMARWAVPSDDLKLPKAVRAGQLKILDTVLRCFVLEDGRRVLSGRTMTNSIGMKGRGQGVTRILTHQTINPFFDNELRLAISKPILFDGSTSRKANPTGGYEGTVLQEICEAILRARDGGKLKTTQELRYAKHAEDLIRAFARVGIIALIDEATGYQEIRAKDELQQILAAYISPSLLPWTERFPMDFWKEMFRVWGWPWPVRGDSGYAGPLGPRYAGKLIRQIIFRNLPPGVLEELDRQNPADKKWQRRNRMTQLLTSDIGHPHVEKLVAVNTVLFRISKNRHEYWRHYANAFPRTGDQLELLEQDD
jgi:hypothetical protein